MNVEFLNQLENLLEPGELISEPTSIEALLVDERNQYCGKACAVVSPKSSAQVAKIMQLCCHWNISVVPQGGNTGYCGGATPDTSGKQLLLCLGQLNKVRSIDVEGFTIIVDAGVTLSEVQRAAADHGLLFPLSMGSEGSCQIGGNLSTNAGGLAVLRYGTARDLVLGLEVVTPDGQILSELKTLRKDTSGYDLKQLFVGAEGTLGVITGATLKLFPRPTTKCVAWIATAQKTFLAPLLRNLQSSVGDSVTSFEYISAASLNLVLAHIPDTARPLEVQTDHYALIEFSGFDDATLFEEKCLTALANAGDEGLLQDAVIAKSDSQARSLWRLRETIPQAEKQLGGSIKHDVSVPISNLGVLIDQAYKVVADIDISAKFSVYGHVGDGNVHFNVLPPQNQDAAVYKKTTGVKISAALHQLAAEMGGSFSAEHGVGQFKVDELETHASALRLALMRTIKSALDPKDLLNPGKVLRKV